MHSQLDGICNSSRSFLLKAALSELDSQYFKATAANLSETGGPYFCGGVLLDKMSFRSSSMFISATGFMVAEFLLFANKS